MLVVLLVLVHLGVAAVWLGAMAYSLIVVQPRAERLLADPQEYELFAATIAAGARWKVLAMMAALAGSGAGLTWAAIAEEGSPSPGWAALVTLKVVLLAGSLALFWYVSWCLWPRRLFALPDELPRVKRRFTVVAVALGATVAANFALGILAAHG